jgi:hypothetical protein
MFDKFITDYINKGTDAQTAVKEKLGSTRRSRTRY